MMVGKDGLLPAVSCGTINECQNLISSLSPREMPACTAVADDADPTF